MSKHEKLSFLLEFLTHPKAVGAVLPSSQFVAREVASHISKENQGLIVELGAGTGVVTKGLLEAGFSADNLVAIERSKTLVKTLKQKYPHVRIIEGDARQLQTMLGDEQKPVNTIISCLPMRSLPEVRSVVLREIATILPAGGKLIQVTYCLIKDKFDDIQHFKFLTARRIWKNSPPARIVVWERELSLV